MKSLTRFFPLRGKCGRGIFGNTHLFEQTFNNLTNIFNDKNNKLTVQFGINSWQSMISSNVSLVANNKHSSPVITTPGWQTRFAQFYYDPLRFILPENSLSKFNNQKPLSETLLEAFICMNQPWLNGQSQLTAELSKILSQALDKSVFFLVPIEQVVIICPSGEKRLDVLLFGCGDSEWFSVVVEIIFCLFVFKHKR